ncbi:MAG: PIN domain-containing protein, partial [Microbacteriaceae bacterium]
MTTRTAQQSTRQASRRSSSDAPDQDLRTYVLDTSVLLSDPQALFRFAEHSIVLPVVVITELEGKRHDPELGYFARQALRHLDALRVEHG